MNYPIKVEIPVAWGEMDALGHVNNVVFFRYFESARIAYFYALLGDKMTSDDFAPILAQTECNFTRPVYFPDTVTAEAGVSKIGNSSMIMHYRVVSKSQGEVVAEGKAIVVNVDMKTGKGRPISDELKTRVDVLQES